MVTVSEAEHAESEAIRDLSSPYKCSFSVVQFVQLAYTYTHRRTHTNTNTHTHTHTHTFYDKYINFKKTANNRAID